MKILFIAVFCFVIGSIDAQVYTTDLSKVDSQSRGVDIDDSTGGNFTGSGMLESKFAGRYFGGNFRIAQANRATMVSIESNGEGISMKVNGKYIAEGIVFNNKNIGFKYVEKMNDAIVFMVEKSDVGQPDQVSLYASNLKNNPTPNKKQYFKDDRGYVVLNHSDPKGTTSWKLNKLH